MEPNGPVRVPFVQSQSYRPIRVHLVRITIHHLAGDPLELPQGPLGVPGPHFENQWSKCISFFALVESSAKPQGHLLLIGVSGAGKTTLSCFVAWMNGL